MDPMVWTWTLWSGPYGVDVDPMEWTLWSGPYGVDLIVSQHSGHSGVPQKKFHFLLRRAVSVAEHGDL